MIYCNLSVLLAERRIKISKISADTGISRTTLTSLALNHWQGVRADTMNALCKYLNVTTGDIFHFLPYDIELVECRYDKDALQVEISFHCETKNYIGDVACVGEIALELLVFPEIGCVMEINIGESEDQTTNNVLREIFAALPVSVITDIKNNISDVVIDEIIRKCNVECDGEIYGYPEDRDLWEATVYLPSAWRKEG